MSMGGRFPGLGQVGHLIGRGTLTVTLFLVLAGISRARCWATGDSGVWGFLLLRP